jgi:hypothetical protein
MLQLCTIGYRNMFMIEASGFAVFLIRTAVSKKKQVEFCLSFFKDND